MRFHPRKQDPRFPVMVALSLAFVSLAQGCGKHAPPPSNEIPTKTLSEAQEIAAKGQVSCASPDACPEAVALLTESTPDHVALCSSFLIAPDLMATNNHCIPDDIKSPGTDCSDRIWIRFPDSKSRPGEQVRCKSIVSTSTKNTTYDPDFAFIRIERALTRQPLAISHGGFANLAEFTVNKINPIPGGSVPVGSLEQVKCKTPQRTLLTPDFQTEAGPLVTLAECEIIHGNSGSPVIDGNGKLRGIVQATIVLDTLKSNLRKQHITLLTEELPPMGIATNFACVRLPTEPADAPLPAGCASARITPATTQQELLNQMGHEQVGRDFDRDAKATVAQWNSGSSPATTHVDWSDLSVAKGAALEKALLARSSSNTSAFLTVTPRCFKPQLDWLGASASSQDLATELPLWELATGLNKYLQLGYTIVPSQRTLHAKLSLNPSELKSHSQSRTTLALDEFFLPSSPPLFDGAIPVCK